MAERLGHLSYRVSRLLRILSCAGLLVMSGIIVWQVFARYVLNDSPAWAEQAALLVMIWYVLLAAAAGVRENFHIRIAAFADVLPGPQRRAAVIASHVTVAAFGVAMVVWGSELAAATWTHVIPTLALPRGVAYLPIVLSGVLIVAFSAEHVAAEIQRTEVPREWS